MVNYVPYGTNSNWSNAFSPYCDSWKNSYVIIKTGKEENKMTGEQKTSYLCFKGYIQQNIIKVTLNWSEQINETNLSVVLVILAMPKLICL